MKEERITLSEHHYENCRLLLFKVVGEGKTFEEVVQEHANWLLAQNNNNYSFLSDVTAMQDYVGTELYAVQKVESELLFRIGVVSVVPDFYYTIQGERIRSLDYLCKMGCKNCEGEDGKKHCRLDG